MSLWGMRVLLIDIVGISKVPIMALKNALLGIMEIIQYNAYQCVV